jgi:hypothetical protein
LLALKSHEDRVKVRVAVNGEDPGTAERAEIDTTLAMLGYSDTEVAAIHAELLGFPMRYVLGVNQSVVEDAFDELDPTSDGA